MRVVTWNIRSLRDSRVDVVDTVRALQPDVLCLQEVPRRLPRRHAERLAGDCGLVVATAGRPVGALAILAAPHLRVVAARRHPLPWRPGRHRRGLARVVVDIAGSRVQVATVHLGLDLDEREVHARRVRELLADNRLPTVIAGDVNETDAFPAWRLLSAGLQDAWVVAGAGEGATFSTARPRRRIDAVFVDDALVVVSCEVGRTDAVSRASDHRPVVAEIRWPPDAGGGG